MPYKTMADVRAANKAAGEHWFSRETIRFFGSRIVGGIRRGRFFITSEDNFNRTKRLYSVREAMPDGSIETRGEFQGYRTVDEAREALGDLLPYPTNAKRATSRERVAK